MDDPYTDLADHAYREWRDDLRIQGPTPAERRRAAKAGRTAPSVKERLARAVIPKMDCAARYDPGPKSCKPDQWELCGCATDVVDAILAELAEPSEGMRTKGHAAGVKPSFLWERLTHEQALELATEYLPAAYRAMIQHIQDGGS